MKSLRPEHILLLVLVLVPLLNLLLRWLQRSARGQQRPPAEPRAAEADAREGLPPASIPRARVLTPVFHRESRRKAPPASAPRPAIRRAGPLGGRAAVRRAIVAMTILGPCRGLEEPPPMPAVGPPPMRR